MRKSLVIFGSGDIAVLAHYYFTNDSQYEVVAFTVDREYMATDRLCELPVVPFDEVHERFPPEHHEMFVALAYAKLNGLRTEKTVMAEAAGYGLASYVSSRATILTDRAFGHNVFILENNVIQPFVEIGRNVTLWSGNHIGHHSTIKDNVFVASHVVVSGGVTIEDSCFIGVNATIRDHVTIGARCVLGAGSLILEDCQPGGVYMADSTERSRVPSSRLRGI